MKKLASFFALSLVLIACSSTSDTNTTESGPTVTIQNFSFSPKEITVKVGDTVHWKWVDGTHSVVSGTNCMPDNKFSSGQPVSGGSFDFKFETAGEYPYYCEPHCLTQGMTGKVIVQ